MNKRNMAVVAAGIMVLAMGLIAGCSNSGDSTPSPDAAASPSVAPAAGASVAPGAAAPSGAPSAPPAAPSKP